MKKAKYINAPTTEQKTLIEQGEKLSDLNGGALRRALDEDVEEMEEFSPENTVDTMPVKKKHSFRRNLYFTVGLFVSIMSIIGIIFTVNWTVGVFKGIADNTSQKEMFEEFILPVVVCDVPVFSGSNAIPNDVILTAAVWDIILYSAENYEENDKMITVPAIDLEAHATKLFGKNLNFTHQTLGDVVLSFPYDDQTQTYLLPVQPYFMSYTPKVSDVSRDGETYLLTVEYYPVISSWMPNNKDAQPDKIMSYKVVKKGGTYSIVEIEELKINHFT